MDLGATICTPKRPACALCPWMTPCLARAAGLQEAFPKKQKKESGPLRRGAAFVVLRADDTVLLRTRPPQGLLGGMAEPPTSAWEPDYEPSRAVLDAPIEARWQRLPGIVRHVFTHFPLELTVLFAKVPRGTPAPEDMRWAPRMQLHEEALPGAMKKVLAHAFGGAASAGKAQPKK
jgi:A/G-specific adenine glycosylase